MKKGQALIFVFFLLLLIGSIIGALSIIWQTEIQKRSLQKYNLRAFYLAQAGIELGKFYAKAGLTIPVTPVTTSGGRFSYSIVSGPGPFDRIITSVGEAFSSSGTVMAEKAITVRVEGIGNPPESQTAWSWKEQ